jgi:kynureninase
MQSALDLDRRDRLAGFRKRFAIHDDRILYLDGNSLGRLPLKTVELVESLIHREWGERLIRSWNERWLDLPGRIAAKIASIIGAEKDEVFVGDSTSFNLYKLAFGALRYHSGRSKIVTDSLNFPSDLYILEGLIRNHFPDRTLETVGSDDDIHVDEQDIEDRLDANTALVALSLVTFKSSFMYDMARISQKARESGTLVLWDLSHAAGAVPVHLKDTHADLAVGCTYKYLNGGPGAPAFLYVRKELQEKLLNPVWGWFGHAKPFDFSPVYAPQSSIEKYRVGTPAVLSLAAVEPGLDMILEAGIDNIREKSLAQSRFLLDLIREYLVPEGFTIGTPEADNHRGSHVSVRHPEGYRINRAMIEPGDGSRQIIPDFRPPDNIRLGVAPLYTSFSDLFEAVARMKQITGEKLYESYGTEKLRVT